MFILNIPEQTRYQFKRNCYILLLCLGNENLDQSEGGEGIDIIENEIGAAQPGPDDNEVHFAYGHYGNDILGTWAIMNSCIFIYPKDTLICTNKT